MAPKAFLWNPPFAGILWKPAIIPRQEPPRALSMQQLVGIVRPQYFPPSGHHRFIRCSLASLAFAPMGRRGTVLSLLRPSSAPLPALHEALSLSPESLDGCSRSRLCAARCPCLH